MSTNTIRSKSVQFEFEGRKVLARPGQSIAAALWATQQTALRTTAKDAAPRGYFCGMGICFDCLVTVDGRPNCRACLVPAADGMVVTRQHGNEADPAPAGGGS